MNSIISVDRPFVHFEKGSRYNSLTHLHIALFFHAHQINCPQFHCLYRVLKIAGEAVGSILRFDPGTLDLGAVLPESPGVEMTVTLTSQSDMAIEVYSLDFDKTYLSEEEMLGAVNIFDSKGLYRATVRHPGEGLPSPVLACYARALSDQERERKRTEGAAEDASPLLLDGNPDNSEDVFFIPPPLRVQPAPRDKFQNQDVLVLGPPLTGCTSIAQQLGRKLHLIVRDIDEILQEVAGTDGEYGLLARRCLGASTENEKTHRKREIEKSRHLSEDSKKHHHESSKRDKKKSKDPVPEIPTTPETLAYDSLIKDNLLHSDSLSNLIAFRLSWIDAGQGFILDGLESSFLHSSDVAAAVAGEFTGMLPSYFTVTLPFSYIRILPNTNTTNFSCCVLLSSALIVIDEREFDISAINNP